MLAELFCSVFCLVCFLLTVPPNPIITERHVCTRLQSKISNPKCTFTLYVLFLNQLLKNKPMSRSRSELVSRPVLTSLLRFPTHIDVCLRWIVLKASSIWSEIYEFVSVVQMVSRDFTDTQSLISEQQGRKISLWTGINLERDQTHRAEACCFNGMQMTKAHLQCEVHCSTVG